MAGGKKGGGGGRGHAPTSAQEGGPKSGAPGEQTYEELEEREMFKYSAGKAIESSACIASLRRGLRDFWAEHGEALAGWWAGLGKEERATFLRGGNPFLPENAETKTVDGLDVEGAVVTMPEMTLESLTAGESLVKLVETRSGRTREEDDDDDLNFAMKLLKEHVLPPQSPPGMYVVYMKGYAGEELIDAGVSAPKEKIAKLLQMAQMGAIVDYDVISYGRERQRNILQWLCVHMDDYRVKILGEKGYALSSPGLGCKVCARPCTPAGTALLMCQCGEVFYCSVECRRSHFAEHKGACAAVKDLQGRVAGGK